MQPKFEQKISSYGYVDGRKRNFLKYGHELRDKQKYGWYIKNIIEIDKDTISVIWERELTAPATGDLQPGGQN